MERLVQVNRDQLAAELRQEMEQLLAKVMDAVNAAKDGRLIEDSEIPVFHLMKDLECRVFLRMTFRARPNTTRVGANTHALRNWDV